MAQVTSYFKGIRQHPSMHPPNLIFESRAKEVWLVWFLGTRLSMFIPWQRRERPARRCHPLTWTSMYLAWGAWQWREQVTAISNCATRPAAFCTLALSRRKARGMPSGSTAIFLPRLLGLSWEIFDEVPLRKLWRCFPSEYGLTLYAELRLTTQ